MLTLREITRENYLDCVRLKVAPEQSGFVASNAFSLAQSKYQPECIPLAIYDDETMVGFTMHCIDADDGEHWIYRLMIDHRYQGKGFGTRALTMLLEEIARDKTRNKVFLSYEPANANAERMYLRMGFVRTGRETDGELILRYDY